MSRMNDARYPAPFLPCLENPGERAPAPLNIDTTTTIQPLTESQQASAMLEERRLTGHPDNVEGTTTLPPRSRLWLPDEPGHLEPSGESNMVKHIRMDAAEVAREYPTFELNALPLPIIHKDFAFTAKDIRDNIVPDVLTLEEEALRERERQAALARGATLRMSSEQPNEANTGKPAWDTGMDDGYGGIGDEGDGEEDEIYVDPAEDDLTLSLLSKRLDKHYETKQDATPRHVLCPSEEDEQQKQTATLRAAELNKEIASGRRWMQGCASDWVRVEGAFPTHAAGYWSVMLQKSGGIYPVQDLFYRRVVGWEQAERSGDAMQYPDSGKVSPRYEYTTEPVSSCPGGKCGPRKPLTPEQRQIAEQVLLKLLGRPRKPHPDDVEAAEQRNKRPRRMTRGKLALYILQAIVFCTIGLIVALVICGLLFGTAKGGERQWHGKQGESYKVESDKFLVVMRATAISDVSDAIRDKDQKALVKLAAERKLGGVPKGATIKLRSRGTNGWTWFADVTVGARPWGQCYVFDNYLDPDKRMVKP